MTATHAHKAVEERLWQDIKTRGGTGMLGLVGSRHHFQPMTAFVEREAGKIWFFTRKDTDLAREIGEGADAMFVFQDDKLQACIGGRLSLAHDRERIERYWNPVVAAWYPDGKDDPQLTLLCMDCADAEVWISDDGMLRFGWEIAAANLIDSLKPKPYGDVPLYRCKGSSSRCRIACSNRCQPRITG